MDIIKKCQEYGLSFVAAVDIKDAVDAYQNYDKLPQATKDSMQYICDQFNVGLTFTHLKRKRLALVGIWNELKSSYLYTDETLADRDIKKHWPKNAVNYDLLPNANHVLRRNQ